MGTTSSGKERANDAQNALMRSLQAVNLKWYEAIQGLIYTALQFCVTQIILTNTSAQIRTHEVIWHIMVVGIKMSFVPQND